MLLSPFDTFSTMIFSYTLIVLSMFISSYSIFFTFISVSCSTSTFAISFTLLIISLSNIDFVSSANSPFTSTIATLSLLVTKSAMIKGIVSLYKNRFEYSTATSSSLISYAGDFNESSLLFAFISSLLTIIFPLLSYSVIFFSIRTSFFFLFISLLSRIAFIFLL